MKNPDAHKAIKARAWENNKVKWRPSRRAYYEKNKDLILAKNKEWLANHPGAAARYNRDFRERLNPKYVASTLNISVADCPMELIEAKRNQVKAHRILKQIKKQII